MSYGNDYADYDHTHEAHQVHGGARSREIEELRSYVAGLREDLQAAEESIRRLDAAVAELREAQGGER